jgi:hypothetical protein
MRREKKIVLGIVLLIAVLFCCEMGVHSCCIAQPIGIEHNTDTNNKLDDIISDVDFFDDEQYNQIFDYIETFDLVYTIPRLQNCNLNHRYFSSIWQPPKIQ